MSQLRRALGDPAAVPAGPAGYALVADAVDALDAARLSAEGSARLAEGDPAAAATACRAGLQLFDTEILPAAGDGDWAAPHRVRLTEVRLRLTEDELAARLALGAAGELVGELEALVAEHPLREGLWALLVTALYRAGRPADAPAAHRRVTRMLADELGVDPGPALADLAHQVLVHDPALGGPPRGNLPAATTALVGRAAELSAVRAALDEHRLVTIVGPAGVGKTRLAVEVARGRPAPDGTWLVRLEGVRTAEELPTTLAEALPGRAGIAGLRGTDLLLVLDNCEHLVDAVADMVTQVVDSAPGVRVLATSQRALGVDGEQSFPLAPLADDDAVALFAARAAAGRRPPGRTSSRSAARSTASRWPSSWPPHARGCSACPRSCTGSTTASRCSPTPPHADRSVAAPSPRRWPGATTCSSRTTSADCGRWRRSPPGRRSARSSTCSPRWTCPGRPRSTSSNGWWTAHSSWSTRTRPARVTDSSTACARSRGSAPKASPGSRKRRWSTGWAALAATVDAGVRGPEQAALVAATAAERATIDAALTLADEKVAADIATGFGWAWVLLDDAGAAARLRPFARPGPDALLLLSFVEAMSGDLGAARAALDRARDGDPDRARWFGGFVLSQEGRYAEAAADLEHCHKAFSARGEPWWAGGSLLLAAFAHLGLGDVPTAAADCAASIRIWSRSVTPGGSSTPRPRWAASPTRPAASPTPPVTTSGRPRRPSGLASRARPPCTSCTWPKPNWQPTTRPPPRRWNAPPRAPSGRATGASSPRPGSPAASCCSPPGTGPRRMSCSSRPTAGTPSSGRARAPTSPASCSSRPSRAEAGPAHVPPSCACRPTSSGDPTVRRSCRPRCGRCGCRAG